MDAPPNQQMIMVQAPNSSEDARELNMVWKCHVKASTAAFSAIESRLKGHGELGADGLPMG